MALESSSLQRSAWYWLVGMLQACPSVDAESLLVMPGARMGCCSAGHAVWCVTAERVVVTTDGR
jgi:hypothetical protein